jgi:hypothetical protein
VVPTANSFPEISEVRFVPGTAPRGLYHELDWVLEKPRVYETSIVAPGDRIHDKPMETWFARWSGDPTL